MQEGDEISVELVRGKKLAIQLLGQADTVDGHTKLFFELNGQPRLIKVAQAGVQPVSSHH